MGISHPVFLSIVLFVVHFGLPVFSEERSEIRLDYPELQVSPRASERLYLEAKREKEKHWWSMLPVQFSSIMTILAGSQVEVDSNVTGVDRSSYGDRADEAVLVGTGWLVLSTSMAAFYTPYQSGYGDIRGLPKKTPRQELIRERLAEEALYAPSTMGLTLSWLSALSQLYVNGQLFSDGSDESTVYAGLGVIAAITPIVFQSRWTSTAKSHKEYKKKIYGPISSLQIRPDASGRLVPGYAFSFYF